MTPEGHRPGAQAEEAVALSLLRLGADAQGPRVLKDLLGRPRLPGVRRGLLHELAEALGVPPQERAALIALAGERAAKALTAARTLDVRVLPWFDPEYPAWLSEIADPPIVLWVRGDVSCLSQRVVAVVGSRRATPAGVTTSRALARDLARAGLVIASGLARGIDGAAHQGALDGEGQTIAVLGCGVDVVYPREHAALMARIAATGAVISEFPPGTLPLPNHFPLRNRIISGLSRAVVVIEASEKSGSLITAKSALDQGRDVLAVPGSVASGRYRGSHALLKDGAALVETVEDVLRELGGGVRPDLAAATAYKGHEINELEATMAPGEPYSVEDLASRTRQSTADLLAGLGELELRGRVTRIPGGGFVRLDTSVIGGGDG